MLAAIFLGPEFPSLAGGSVGLAIVLGAARKGWFMPGTPWEFPPRDRWEHRWTGTLNPEEEAPAARMSIARAWVPYAVVGGLLLVTRLVPPVQEFLQEKASFTIGNILGTGLEQQLEFLWYPGAVLIVASVAAVFAHRMTREHVVRAWKTAATQVVAMASALLFAVPLVRVFINSGAEFNTAGLDSMPLTLANVAAEFTGLNWPVLAPWIGALGAFAAGTNTVSNLMFSLFQFHTAEGIGVSPETVVASQAVGGAAGNMVAVHNVVAVAATVGFVGREGDIIRRMLIPVTYYLLAAGAVASLTIFGLGLNLGTLVLALLLAGAALFITRGVRSSRKAPVPERVGT